jgi:hypothetical protein
MLNVSPEFAPVVFTDSVLKKLSTNRPHAHPYWLLWCGFDPRCPYQLSLSLHRTCQCRKAAKGSNIIKNGVGERVKPRGEDGKPTLEQFGASFRTLAN